MPSSDFHHFYGASPAKNTAFKIAERVESLLEEGRAHTTLSRSAFFTQALRVWDAMLRETDLDEYLNTICLGVEKAMTQLTQAFEILLAEASAHYLDVLALVYMLHRVRANNGEEYTPWDIVQLMVRLTMRTFIPPEPGDSPRLFYDPCCGSGSTLLGCMEYLDTYYPEVLDRGQARFYGQDRSYEAYLMARINIRLHVLGRLRRSQAARPAIADAKAETSTSDGQETPSHGLVPSPESASAFPKNEPLDGLAPLFLGMDCADPPENSLPGQPCLPGFDQEDL